MLVRVTEEQLQLLETAVDAYWSNEAGKPKHDLYFSTGMGVGTAVQHPALGEEERSVDVGDIEELQNLGLLNVNWRADLVGSFRPTAEGSAVVEDQRKAAEAARSDLRSRLDGPGVAWEVTQPVLKAIVDLYDKGGPGDDVMVAHVCSALEKGDEDPSVARAVEVLIRGRYVEKKVSSWGGPISVAPTEKALQLFAGWPTSGEAAAQKLLSILDERIDYTRDEEAQGKLKKLRESVVDIGESITAEVLVKLMTG